MKIFTLLFLLLLYVLISLVLCHAIQNRPKKISKLVGRLHNLWLLYYKLTSGFLSILLRSYHLLSPAHFSIWSAQKKKSVLFSSRALISNYHVLQINLLQIHVLLIHLLQIHLLQIHCSPGLLLENIYNVVHTMTIKLRFKTNITVHNSKSKPRVK